MKNKKKRGFTLVELVIVIAIIGMLLAIAVPRYQQSKHQAAVAAHNANVHMLESAATMRLADGLDEESVNWPKNGDSDKYVQNWPKVPNGLPDAGKEYSVKITKTGTITVTPVYTEEDKTN